MIKQILDKLLIKKLGYVPYKVHRKQIEIIYNQLFEIIQNQKNEINNLKKRIKYAAEKKYL